MQYTYNGCRILRKICMKMGQNDVDFVMELTDKMYQYFDYEYKL